MNDSELVSLAKAGDTMALTNLVKKYERTIYNFAYKICRDRDKAENAMQDTFVSMVRSLNQFDGKSQLSTWLYRIVTNHCLMDARKRQRHSTHDISYDDVVFDEGLARESADLPEDSVENDELKQVLDDAITRLAPEYRVVFLLRDVEQFSTEETANMLELTVPAVKSRLHRARAFLRNEITKAYKDA